MSKNERCLFAIEFHFRSGRCSLHVYKSTKAVKLIEKERI